MSKATSPEVEKLFEVALGFHIDHVVHDRAHGTVFNPDCDGCPIRRYCQYGDGEMGPDN